MTDTLGPGEAVHIASPLQKFFEATKRLEELTDLKLSWSPIGMARSMPAVEMRLVDRVRIEGPDGEDATVEVAKAIRAEFSAIFLAKGHQKRRAALDEIAHEIDTLRAKLPQLAVDAVYQMGEIARQVRDEASK